MDSFQSCRFLDQFWIKVFCLSDKSCIGVTVLMIVHFLKFDSPIWNFEFIWNMCICKRIYVWNICGRWCVISDVAATKSDSRIQDDFVAQISTLCRRRKSDQGFMMPRPRDGFLQIYQESNVRGGAHCGGWFTPHYRFLPPCARGGSGVFLQ